MRTRVRIELRKLADTRAGLVLLVAIAAGAVASVAVQPTLGLDDSRSAVELAVHGSAVSVYLLPILGIAAAVAEWRRATALTTYALDPHRSRVLSAKLVAVLIVAAGVALLVATSALVVASLERLPVGGALAFAAGIGELTVCLGLLTVLGFGLGAALLNTPAALVVVLVGTEVVPQLLGLSRWTAGAVPFVDIERYILPRTHGLSPEQPLAALVAIGLWIGLPLLIGFVRNARTDVT